jgi:glutamine---fructose-6-phosphate transaminase (isomerizing)
MYEEIKAQAEAVERSLYLVREQEGQVASVIARGHRVFLTGCGTSFHAARSGAYFLRSFSRGKIDARSVQAFELTNYRPGIRPDDVVIGVSHSATTLMTLSALKAARDVGAETILVTGFPDRAKSGEANHVVATGYEDEKSWAHTISYTAALATFAALANELAVPEERLDLKVLPPAVADALNLEEMGHRLAGSTILAERYREAVQIIVTGAGPNSVTASEAVLKLLETSYVQATAFQLEEMLHGPLASVTPDTLLIIVAPSGASTSRASELIRAARQIGTMPVVLTGEGNTSGLDEAHRIFLADVPEVLSPLTYVIPLQFFSYFLSIGRGMNPDLLRRDDDRYRAAAAAYE